MDRVVVEGDSLRCPICLTLPESYVYQCKNGHVICQKCSENLTNCPQCRVEYETVKIRCRVLENILDNMAVDCTYKSEGCVKAILRKELSQHRESCEFKPIEFCKLVGYTDCTFSSHDGCKIVNHLREIHSVPFVALGTISLQKESRHLSAIVPLGLMKPMTPAPDSTNNFLLCQIFGQCQTVSVIAIHFGKQDDCVWDVQYNIQDEKYKSKFLWQMSPISFNNKNINNYFASPPFQIPKLYLEEIQARKNTLILADVIVSIDSSKPYQITRIPEHNQSNAFALEPSSKITVPTSNDEMVQKLKSDGIIKSDTVMQIMLAVDRGHFVSDKSRAYRNAEWKEGGIHLSSPAIYATVLEALELRPQLRFLNIGSGTGYFSTMVGMAVEECGVNFGMDCNFLTVGFALDKQNEFKQMYNPQKFTDAVFWIANIYEAENSAMTCLYDRVYCGAQCPKEDVRMFHKFLKEGGICVVPVDGSLLKIRRNSENDFESTVLMSATFEPLIKP